MTAGLGARLHLYYSVQEGVDRAEAAMQDTSNRKSPEELREMSAAAAEKEIEVSIMQRD